MAAPSVFTIALHEAFRRDFLPLLAPLGFASAKLPRVKPGLATVLAVADLDGRRRAEVSLWCAAKTGATLRFRLDVVAPNDAGIELTHAVPLVSPWPESSSPRPRSIELMSGEFLPHQSPAQLEKAVGFLAGAFAANAGEVARAIPELGERIAGVAAGTAYREAAERAARLWRSRHLRGEVDRRRVAARVVFVGERLVTVEAEGARHSFHFDTRAFDRSGPVELADWYANAGGTRVATTLANGAATWTFDAAGQLV